MHMQSQPITVEICPSGVVPTKPSAPDPLSQRNIVTLLLDPRVCMEYPVESTLTANSHGEFLGQSTHDA